MWKDRFKDSERERIVEAGQEVLWSKAGKEALDYLRYQRKINDKTIKKFEMGYCPRYAKHQLKGRLITPIRDVYGNYIAISTRLLMNDNKKTKFWHERFEKSYYLYGLYYAKNSILKNKKIIVVEGEMDVASLHTNGFVMTVGICGSAFSLFQASKIARYCPEVYFLFDSDKAGELALKKVLKIYEEYGLKNMGIDYIPVKLPSGYDPDKYVNEFGKKSLKKCFMDAKEEYKVFG